MRSFMDDARDAIAAAGPLASVEFPGATVWRLCEWLDWPSWIRSGTSLTGEGPLPHKITYADRLVITANLMEHADLAYLLDRALNGRRLPVSPISTTMFRNAPTLGELLERGVGFAPAGTPDHTYSFERVGDNMVYSCHPVMPTGRLADLHAAFFSVLLYAQVADFVLDKIADLKIDLMLTDERLSDLIRALFRCEVNFGQETNRVIFPSQWGDIRNDDNDEALWLVAMERGEANTAAGRERASISRIRERISEIIRQSHRVPRLHEIAAELNVSTRTLVRIISASGTRFQAIVEEERRVLAAQLVNEPSISLADVASALGFASVPSFNRAFRKWFGVTPGAMRKSVKV